MTLPIAIIKTHGTHYEVGQQIGVAARGAMRAMHAETLAEYGARWEELLALSEPFIEKTRVHLPKVLDELRGCADGAGIPVQDMFLMSVEELLYEEVRGGDGDTASLYQGDDSRARGEMASVACDDIHRRPLLAMTDPFARAGEKSKGCSDLAAAPPATKDGHVWLAHNNDLGKSAYDQLFVTHFCVDGEPEILAVTVGGLFISIGLNNAGICLTGNQLNANDSRVGVPRLLLVRDILAQTNVEDALAAALHPERASSYNNIISSKDGRIVNAEGSATSAALTWSHENEGTVAHTNHYLGKEMLAFESDAKNVAMSASRCARAFDYARKYRGEIDFEVCARFVRDHVYEPWSVCKHAGQSVTVFSTLIDLTEGKLWVTHGNPCQSEFSLYTF